MNLLKLVKLTHPFLTKKLAMKVIKNGDVRVDGNVVKLKNHVVDAGDKIRIYGIDEAVSQHELLLNTTTKEVSLWNKS